MSKVQLVPYGLQHYEKTVEWLNISSIQENFGVVNKISLDSHTNWVKSLSNAIIKAIYVDNCYIGNILLHTNQKHHSGFFQIYIGEAQERGKGYAKQALQYALTEFFERLDINRIWLKVFEENKTAIHIYKSIGFKQEGVERESFYYQGNYKNQLVFSILKEEWVK
ncbi:GNAT family N-acetyltransferase [Rummeliibacillus sp. NPDC094406]|uniref:GNAT family N-acetyltransferase n=1 Tax=Rummeliibacillus sp. NPDC094406 TaxID=3364511 RepID=UPI00381CBDF1